MDFDKIFIKSTEEKYKLEIGDENMDNDGGVIDFYIESGIPDNVEADIVVDVDGTYDTEYVDGTFVEDFGNGPERCDTGSGMVATNANASTSGVKYQISGEDVTEDTFLKETGITSDELVVLTKHAKSWATSHWESWIEENWSN